MARFRIPRFTLKDLEKFGPLDTSPKSPNELGLVMTGGGARGAYQVGMLRCLARRFPDLEVPIVTGVSAGAVNAVHLAAHHGSLAQAVDELTALWSELTASRTWPGASHGGAVASSPAGSSRHPRSRDSWTPGRWPDT
jgi:predicted acylesterase/phospholipase RssA